MSKNLSVKIISIALAVITLFSAATLGVSAFPKPFSHSLTQEQEELRSNVANEVVDIALAQKGYYDSNVNKFTSWYYGFDTDASWCAIFVSWCASQAGALGTAVPKRAACSSMKKWFEDKGRFYPADSNYVPQKGDIVFLNTAVDGTDDIHHVEIITQSGFIVKKGVNNIKCIGGNTSDINYNGSEYVTEKVRPVNGSKAAVVGYAHPSYEKSSGFKADIYTNSYNSAPAFFRYVSAKMLEMLCRIEAFFSISLFPISQ